MARTANPLSRLMKQFSSDIEAAIAARVNDEFAARFDDLRDSVISAVAQGGGSKSRRGKQPLGTFALRRKPGPRAGTIVAEQKPCPICGEKNKARRFSYLCDAHRSVENLAKFKSARSAAVRAARNAAKRPAAPAETVKAPRAAKVPKAAKIAKASKAPKAAKTVKLAPAKGSRKVATVVPVAAEPPLTT
jgi:hypothetical protein